MTIEGGIDKRGREAADWFALLNQRRVATADLKAFSAWRRDPENARAFGKLEAVWDTAGGLANTPEIARMKAEARTSACKGARGEGRRIVLVGVGAGTVAALVLGATTLWWSQQPTRYTTAIGEQRTIALEDGSRLTLDTASEAAVRLSGSRRSVELTHGQAMFDVASDARRPFVVQAGDARIIAVGTRFDVRRSGDGARVVLVEGRVDVRVDGHADSRWSLTPGQQVTTSATRPRIAVADVAASTSWIAGRLTFDETPIAQAVAEMNRYSRAPIELRDDRVSSVLVSGVFNAGDTEGFVAALTDLYALEVTRGDDGRAVLSRRQ